MNYKVSGTLWVFLSVLIASANSKHHHKKKKYIPGIVIPTSPSKLPPLPNNTNFCQNFIKNEEGCSWKGQTSIHINSSNPCFFNCNYDPTKSHPGPVRMSVSLRSDPFASNMFISVRQNHLESTWTLPILFAEHGENQPFTTIEEVLCPPRREALENLYFRIETNSLTNITLNVSLSRTPYEIKLEDQVIVTTSPVSSWFKVYEWEDGQESVLVTADSNTKKGTKVCALLSLQNARCPIETDKKGILGAGSGRYQTFQERGGMVAKRDLFPDGVHIVVLPLPDDALCTGYEEDFSNKTSRAKSTALQVLKHKTLSETWGIFAAVAAILSAVIISSTFLVIHLGIKRNVAALSIALSTGAEDDQLIGYEEDADENSAGVTRTFQSGGLYFANGVNADQQQVNNPRVNAETEMNNHVIVPDLQDLINQVPEVNPDGSNGAGGSRFIRNRLLAIEGGSANVNNVNGGFLVPLPESGIPQALDPTLEFNPRCVFWWKMSAQYNNFGTPEDIEFHKNLLTVAVFMALPLSEILRSYLHVFHYHGSEDQCYFNSRCIVSCGIFPDFARVFTNYSYLLCGASFAYILTQHKKLLYKISKGELLGVTHNYSLFMALAVGLGIQFVMSGLYHICPNIVTLRFDMMFMYVEAIVLVIGVWGLRHDNVAPHVYPTVGIVGVALLVAECKDWVNYYVFWTMVFLMQTFFTLTISVMMYKTSSWSFSPMQMLRIWKKWKPLVRKMSEDLFTEDTSIRPWTLFRMILGVVTNLTMQFIGMYLDLEIYFYILMVCLVNMGLYVGNYIFTKKLNREKGTTVAWICLLTSLIFWIFGITFFLLNNTNTETTAAASRAMNADCILLGVFDSHDMWHITSALALFYLFIGILTLDDDLAATNPLKFNAF